MPDYMSGAPDKVEAKNENEISLLINDKLFKYWNDITIIRSFDTVADQFSLSCPFYPNNKTMKELFRPFMYNECVIYVGEDKVLTGTMMKVIPKNTANSQTVTVEGYSLPGVLADCQAAVSSWPLSIIGLDLKQIAEKLAEPYGIIVTFDGDPGAKFTANDRIEIETDEKIYELLTRLARERGFVISSMPDGEMYFRKTVNERATVRINSGEPPYLNSSAEYNGQERYSDIIILKAGHRGGVGGKYTIKDAELTANGIFRQLVDNADDTEKGNLKTAAIWRLGRMLAEAIPISLSCIGWRRPDNNKLWQDGQKLIFYSPGDMIYEPTELLIREVKLNKKNNEMTSDFTLVLPESYSGEERKEFPWAS
jgi:prophage tail gpP-like protein